MGPWHFLGISTRLELCRAGRADIVPKINYVHSVASGPAGADEFSREDPLRSSCKWESRNRYGARRR